MRKYKNFPNLQPDNDTFMFLWYNLQARFLK